MRSPVYRSWTPLSIPESAPQGKMPPWAPAPVIDYRVVTFWLQTMSFTCLPPPFISLPAFRVSPCGVSLTNLPQMVWYLNASENIFQMGNLYNYACIFMSHMDNTVILTDTHRMNHDPFLQDNAGNVPFCGHLSITFFVFYSFLPLGMKKNVNKARDKACWTNSASSQHQLRTAWRRLKLKHPTRNK